MSLVAVEAAKNITGKATLGSGVGLVASEALTEIGIIDRIGEHAIAIGAICTMITCAVFVISNVVGIYFKWREANKQTRS